MTVSKLFLLIILFSSFITSTSSYPSIKASSPIASRESPPVEKRKSVKKRKKKPTKKRLKFKSQKPDHGLSQPGPPIFVFVIIAILFFLSISILPIAFIITGGILGLVGWIYAGFVISCISLLFTCFLIFNEQDTRLPLAISLFYTLASLALLIWGLLAILPIINIFSIILGGIALILFLVSLIMLVRSSKKNNI